MRRFTRRSCETYRYHYLTYKQYGNEAQLGYSFLVLSKIGRVAVRWSRQSSRTIKLTLSAFDDSVSIYAFPMGNYVDISAELSVCVSSWRRVSGNAAPVRAKTTDAYINSCLAVDEAAANGFDEAIFLAQSGATSEGSSCNLFIVKDRRVSATRAA